MKPTEAYPLLLDWPHEIRSGCHAFAALGGLIGRPNKPGRESMMGSPTASCFRGRTSPRRWGGAWEGSESMAPARSACPDAHPPWYTEGRAAGRPRRTAPVTLGDVRISRRRRSGPVGAP